MPANASQFSALLIDIDGVIRQGSNPVPGAVEAVIRLRRSGIPLRFVTNTSTMSRRSLRSELQTMGFDLEESEILSAPAAVADYLRNSNDASCFLIAKGDVAEPHIVSESGRAVVAHAMEWVFGVNVAVALAALAVGIPMLMLGRRGRMPG